MVRHASRVCLGLVVGALTVCLAPPVQAQTRVALVIGNSAYRHVPVLPNTRNDAGDVATSFERLGFAVQRVDDGGFDAMRRALLEFSRKARDAEMAVVFFAGHGMEVGGENWLIPVDAELKTDLDAEQEAISLKAVMLTVSAASRLGLVVLDACRNNPFAATMQRTLRMRAVERGFARVEPTGSVLVAFAARDGTTAADGTGRNSPFTAALLRHLETPGLEINFLFRNVRDDVIVATRRRQEPFLYGSLSKETIYLKEAPAKPAAPTPDQIGWNLLKETNDAAALKTFIAQFPDSPLRPQAEARIAALAAALDRADYELAARVGTREAWDSFLAVHPTGLYADLARAQRDELLASAAPKPPAAEPASARAHPAEHTQPAAQTNPDEQAKPAGLPQPAGQMQHAEHIQPAAQTQPAEQMYPDELAKAAEPMQLAELTTPVDQTKPGESTRLAAVTPAQSPQPAKPLPAAEAAEVVRQLQVELKRVGCFDDAVDGNWGPASRRALTAFNTHARTELEVKLASIDSLDAVKARPSRVCPLACDRGFRAVGDACVAITCKAGFVLGSDGSCRRQTRRDAVARPDIGAKASANKKEKPEQGQRVVCGGGVCRTVPKGCRVERDDITFATRERIVCP
jgi:hypothetical protein